MLTQLGQLVAQGARADAEPIGHRLAAAVAILQGVENNLMLLLLELVAQVFAAAAAALASSGVANDFPCTIDTCGMDWPAAPSAMACRTKPRASASLRAVR